MNYRIRVFSGLIGTALLVLSSLQAPVFAKSEAASAGQGDKQRYIVILDDLPLATYDGRLMLTPERNEETTRLQPTANRFTGARKLDVNSQSSKKYLQFLDERFRSFSGEALLRLGRQLQTVHRYRNAVNGFTTELSAAEVRTLRDMPGVSAVVLDGVQHLETDSGPNWIGASNIYNGTAGDFPPSGGEGIIVGMIDTGVNWDHPSFQDPGESGSGWDHTNPIGSELGLCSESEVLCNDKLIGVYDFVQDDPDTEEEDENTNGKDISGHGSHTASTAAGNPVNVTFSGRPATIAGVAPNANIISYRVCGGADGNCQSSAILSAIDQAIADGVDVVNHSIGGDTHDPWIPGTTTLAFLNLRAAGIFVATSASNEGPNAGSIGSPANAPWMTAVGNATHDRLFAGALENLSGGDTTPPPALIGASSTDGLGIKRIVHAKDFGNALCGTGDSSPFQSCASNSSTTNPFPAGTFDGEIVVCDRGNYGRVEKGLNVRLAGASGYVLANTQQRGEVVNVDIHCLPAVHIGEKNGDKLRTWLEGGNDHQGSLSGFFDILQVPDGADSLSANSSRGPNLPPVENVMKPDVIAPGTLIMAAWKGSPDFDMISGTSMASPHVTGGAALLKSVHPDWTPAMLVSALVMTATPELAKDFDGSTATVHKRGAGRPRLDQAVNAGLYLDETVADFVAANPLQGGDPGELNLPGLVNTGCHGSCNFQRQVTDLVGGATWSASAEGLPNGVSVSITPSFFSLNNGASRLLSIDVDLSHSEVVGSWVYGEVRLSSSGLPDAVFPLAVFAGGGELPVEWQISSDGISGWQEFALSGLAAMPDATFTSGGLVVPTETVEDLPEDPSNDSPYDGSEGLMTVWHTVTADALWLHTETLDSTAFDLDLFVGLDSNGDGIAQESEELCSSTSPGKLEFCDLFTPVAGEYWVIVQNWKATNSFDEVTLKSAVVGKNTLSPLAASGNGIVAAGEAQTVRLSWDNVNAVPGTELLGAVGIGTRREAPNNIGIIPVTFSKTGVADPETLVLMNGIPRGLTVGVSGMHDRAFIDIPPGTDTLTVTASGADGVQSENLVIELYRVDFNDAFAAAPFVDAADMNGAPLASASGANGNGPTVSVSGAALVAGRWFAVLKNNRSANAAVTVQADLTFSGDMIPLRVGMWEASSRANLRQGFEYTSTGDYRGFLWFTYDEDGSPAWYLAAAAEPEGNVWVAELLRFTNDGSLQQAAPVGHVSVTLLAEDDSIFSFVLFGEDGSDREFPSLPQVCPIIDGTKRSYTGHWARAAVGVGGATVVVNATSQAFVHYIYGDSGTPAWLLSSPSPQGPEIQEMPLLQFGGYCAVCSTEEISIDEVGVFNRDFVSEDSLIWNLDYVLMAPLSGSIDRSDDVGKLTFPLACP